jgi:hypothetical protein
MFARLQLEQSSAPANDHATDKDTAFKDHLQVDTDRESRYQRFPRPPLDDFALQGPERGRPRQMVHDQYETRPALSPRRTHYSAAPLLRRSKPPKVRREDRPINRVPRLRQVRSPSPPADSALAQDVQGKTTTTPTPPGSS